MNIKKINPEPSKIKNTFLEKSKHAVNQAEKYYYESLDYEAKARMHYLKFQRTERELDNAKSNFDLMKIFYKMAKEKWQSFIFTTNAYKACPKRFVEPDNLSTEPLRHYKVKDAVKVK